MDILELLDNIEDVVDKAGGIPLTGRAMIDKDELLDLLQELRLNLPDDLKQAKWIKEERQRILSDAQKEAADIIKTAEEKIVTLIDEHEITKKAIEQANGIIDSAQKNARELRMGAKKYADDILAGLEEKLSTMIDTINTNREELRK